MILDLGGIVENNEMLKLSINSKIMRWNQYKVGAWLNDVKKLENMLPPPLQEFSKSNMRRLVTMI